MGRPTRATQAKRNRERAKQERREEKNAERAIRKEQRRQALGDPSHADEDPDLIGIVPGPQPQPIG